MSSPMPIRDPAPHRGFNSKAREVLLDTTRNCQMQRSGSDEEFLRRVGLVRIIHRADSEDSDSQSSKKDSEDKQKKGEFDGIDDLPKWEKKIRKLKTRTLEEIGKTRSAGDLLKMSKVTRTFRQMNIVKLPSAESEAEHILTGEKALMTNADSSAKRTAQYSMQ